MRTRLIAAAALALATAPVVVAAAPAAPAAEPCTPSITAGKPYQDATGAVYFPVSFTVCDNSSRVTLKWRDRDTDTGWAKGVTKGWVAGSWETHAATYVPDGKAHRWVFYATIKPVNSGTLTAQTPKVYFKSAPVTP